MLPFLAIALGLVVLIWSADRFVSGAVAISDHFSVPPLLIGMVIIGFGTSAPEMMVSALAAWDGNAGLALGNALGSNIANIALILGVTAIIAPIPVQSGVVRKEIPILLGLTGVTAALLLDDHLSRFDAFLLLGAFAILTGWSCFIGFSNRHDPLEEDVAVSLQTPGRRPLIATFWVITGLVLLVASSRALVWGAVEIADALGVSDLVIGLTIVAIGTSLPEFAASVSAARKGHADLAIGNILGSNLFNTVAVVGIAGVITPTSVPPEVLERDILVVAALTCALLFMSVRVKKPGQINRAEGVLLVLSYAAYTAWLLADLRSV